VLQSFSLNVISELAKPLDIFTTTWTEDNAPVVRQLIVKMSQRAVRAQPAYTTLQWKALLQDMTQLCCVIFPFLEQEYAYSQFCRALLRAASA